MLAGCATNNCAGWQKLKASTKDTILTQQQILEHDKFGIAQGCWTARD